MCTIRSYVPRHAPQLAKALGVSVEQLLGIEKVKVNGRVRDTRLWRRFREIEKLPAREKRQILQLVDAFLERDKLKQQIEAVG
jgi:hypothetical protein